MDCTTADIILERVPLFVGVFQEVSREVVPKKLNNLKVPPDILGFKRG